MKNYKPNFSGVVERSCAKTLVEAWLNVRATVYDGEPGFCIHYFDPSEFGRAFDALGFPNKRVRVEISFEETRISS